MHHKRVLFLNPDFKSGPHLSSLLEDRDLSVVFFESKSCMLRKHEIAWWLSTHSCNSFVIVDTERRYGVYDPRVALLAPGSGWTATLKAEVLRLFDEDAKLSKWG